MVGGKKGALVGALLGGGGAALYTATKIVSTTVRSRIVR
jgi:hypothetical protein